LRQQSARPRKARGLHSRKIQKKSEGKQRRGEKPRGTEVRDAGTTDTQACRKEREEPDRGDERAGRQGERGTSRKRTIERKREVAQQ